MDSRITLRLDRDVIEQAREYAREQGTSLSRIIENYLKIMSKPRSSAIEVTPLVKSLSGIAPPMTDPEMEDARLRHIMEKHS
jgi:hypothetical protein